MYDSDLARRVEKGFGIHTAFSTSALAAPIFAAAAMRVNIIHSFYIGDELLNLGELTIESGSRLTGWTVNRLETEMDLSVVCCRGNGTTNLHPDPNIHLEVGDKILVITSLETLQRLNALNSQATPL
jgi:Trk K+ transport system NAD-binding subunit